MLNNRLKKCLLLASLTTVLGVASAQPPNIVMVISDDHRWDAMGVVTPAYHTPAMDRLAREGVYFREGTISNPQCLSSRAVLLTGLATHSNGCYSNQTHRADIDHPLGFLQYQCLPQVLADAGYYTAFSGKWHLDADPWNVGFQKIGTWMPPGSGPYKNAPLAQGKSRIVKQDPRFVQKAFGDSAREMVTTYAESGTTQPLFLWFSLTAPHSPFRPNPRAANAPYKGKKNEDLVPPTFTTPNEKTNKNWLDYAAAITSVDLELERLMETLDDTGLSSNTVIVFLGDNGFMMGNRGLYGKAVPYEDSIRVPMMIWGPGVINASGVTEAVASSLDLPPTIVKLAGVKVPEDWQGRDLTPVLEDGQPHGITWAVAEAPDYQNWKFPGISYRTIRTTTSKLIIWHESTGKEPEFYDLVTDPEEEKNLYADAAMKDRVNELQRLLDEWMKETDDSWEMRGELLERRGGRRPGRASDE